MTKNITFLILFISFFLKAQVFDFYKSFGGSQDDYFIKHIESSDNDYVFAGGTLSNNGDITINYGMIDIFLTKINADGNYVWKKNLGGNADDIPLDLIKSNDGGMILISQSKSNTHTFNINRGNNDLWMTKLDVNGNIVWNNTISGSGNESNAKIIPLASGYIMAINTDSYDYDFSHTTNTNKDVWIIRLDEAGNIIWKKILNGALNDKLGVLKKIDDNNFVILVNSGSTDGDYSSNTVANKNKGFLFTMDVDGNVLMSSEIESANVQNENFVNDVKATNDGYILTGKENEPYVSGNNISYDNYNAFFAKVSSSGTLIWKKYYSYGTNADGIRDEGKFVEETSDNNYLFFGETGNEIGSLTGGWMIKIDPTGNVLKNTPLPVYPKSLYKLQGGSFGINGYGYADIPMSVGKYSFRIMFINSMGTVVIYPDYTIRTNQVYTDYKNASIAITSDNKVLNFWTENPGLGSGGTGSGTNVWFSRFPIVGSLSVSEDELNNVKKNITLYPNPTHDFVKVSEKMEVIIVYDSSGREILRIKNTDTVNVSSFNSGVYFFKVYGKGFNGSYQIIKR